MKKILFIFLVSMFVAGHVFANALSSFVNGNEAYKAQHYDKAIVYYEDILKEGKEGASIYFNLGNAYYKTNNLGKAVLNYQRALRLRPRDSDIRFNLKYVSGLLQSSNITHKNSFQKMVDGHIQYYTLDEMIFIMTLSIFALGIVFLLSRFFKWPKNIRYSTRLMCLVIFIIFSVGLFLKISTQHNAAIILEKTPAFYEPYSESTEHFQLYAGSEVKFIRREEGWTKIERPDGLMGWVPADTVEAIQ